VDAKLRLEVDVDALAAHQLDTGRAPASGTGAGDEATGAATAAATLGAATLSASASSRTPSCRIASRPFARRASSGMAIRSW